MSVKLRCVENNSNVFLVDSLSGIYSSLTKGSLNSSSGSFVVDGGVSINCTSNSSSVTQGGALTIRGGASIANDLYIGGQLYVNGNSTTFISGSYTLGTFTSGSHSFNIGIGQTLGNINYKVLGNTKTTAGSTGIYAVSFNNMTTYSFDANIVRLDSIFAGNSDPSLSLSWELIP